MTVTRSNDVEDDEEKAHGKWNFIIIHLPQTIEREIASRGPEHRPVVPVKERQLVTVMSNP